MTIEEFMLEPSHFGYRNRRYYAGLRGNAFHAAGTNPLATVQVQLARKVASFLPVKLFEPPIEIPTLNEPIIWHPRHDADPAHFLAETFISEVAALI